MNGVAADKAGWDSRANRENIIDQTMARDSRGEIADMFADAENYQGLQPNQIIAAGVRGNAFDNDYDQMAKLFQVSTGNMGGTDEQRAGAYVGGGKTIDVGDAFSLAGQQDIADRDFDYGMDKQDDQQAASMQEVFAKEQAKAQYGTGTGTGTSTAMEVKRWADVEDSVDQATTDLVAGLGYLDEAPGELFNILNVRAMDLVRNQGLSPREAVSRASQEINLEVDQDRWLPYDADNFTYDQPEQQGQSGGNVIQEAADAIVNGADPEAVRERLRSMGYSDQQISEGGL